MNHSIQYALMPIMRLIGKREGKNIYDIDCYIVSKCYVIKKDDMKKYQYEVVFPFKSGEDGWMRNQPIYNTLNGRCMNAFYTDQVFHTYQEALVVKDIKNDEINREQYRNRFLSRVEVQELRKRFDKKMEYYNTLESLMSIETNDMIVEEIVQKNQK